MGQLAHFISPGLSPSHNSSALSQGETFPLSQGEREIGSFGHFQFPHVLSQYESILTHSKVREGLDGSVTFCSFAALRVTAGGRNP